MPYLPSAPFAPLQLCALALNSGIAPAKLEDSIETKQIMSAPENNSPRPNYKWPWFVLAFVIVGFALAVVWVTLAAKKVAAQRDFAPLPATAPAR